MSKPEIETTRLILRQFTLDDADNYYRAILSNPDVMRYLPEGHPCPREYADVTIRRLMNGWDQHGFGVWAVIYKTAGELIGHGGLQFSPGTTEVEVICALAKPYWRLGLAPEIAQACLRFGFEQMQFSRIIAVAAPENAASLHVMCKLGMVSQGVGHYYDTELPCYALTRAEFAAGNAPYTLRGR